MNKAKMKNVIAECGSIDDLESLIAMAQDEVKGILDRQRKQQISQTGKLLVGKVFKVRDRDDYVVVKKLLGFTRENYPYCQVMQVTFESASTGSMVFFDDSIYLTEHYCRVAKAAFRKRLHTGISHELAMIKRDYANDTKQIQSKYDELESIL